MSTNPIPPKADKTVLYVVLGVGGGFLLLCIAPALIIVVCLTAIQLLGKNTCTTFQTVGMSIGSTTTPQRSAKESAEEFVDLLLEAQYERAFARTTPEFQQANSPQTLQQLRDGNPVLRKGQDLSYVLAPRGQSTSTRQNFLVQWANDAGRTRMGVEVTRSAPGDWQVSRLELP